MIHTPDTYTNTTPESKTVRVGQHENGIHWGEIRDELGAIEFACTRDTAGQVDQWLREHAIVLIGYC